MFPGKLSGTQSGKAMVMHPSAAFWAAAALGLLSLFTLPSESGAVRASYHGLAFQKNTTGAPPLMAAFFRGDGGVGVALPEARNATGSAWEERATPIAVAGGRDRLRTVLLTVAVACGAAGVALLAVVALAYLVQARRGKARRRGNVEGGPVSATAGTSGGHVRGGS